MVEVKNATASGFPDTPFRDIYNDPTPDIVISRYLVFESE